MELFALYSQEQNGIVQRLGRILMDIVQEIIIKENIDNCFRLKAILTIMHIKNIRLISMLQGLSCHKSLHNNLLELDYLQVPGYIVYVFIHQEEQDLKSKKFAPKALKKQLIGFDHHTIYCIHIEKQNQVIRIKDLHIFEDIEIKENIILSKYKNSKLFFQNFLLEYNNDEIFTTTPNETTIAFANNTIQKS